MQNGESLQESGDENWPIQGFFLPILWCSHTRDHPQEELAKFGYSSERTEEKLRILLYFGCHVGTYCLNMANLHQIFCNIFFGANLVLIWKKSFVLVALDFFIVAKWWKFPRTKNAGPSNLWELYIKGSTEDFLTYKFKILKNTIQHNKYYVRYYYSIPEYTI
jgi:hypothetical protein